MPRADLHTTELVDNHAVVSIDECPMAILTVLSNRPSASPTRVTINGSAVVRSKFVEKEPTRTMALSNDIPQDIDPAWIPAVATIARDLPEPCDVRHLIEVSEIHCEAWAAVDEMRLELETSFRAKFEPTTVIIRA